MTISAISKFTRSQVKFESSNDRPLFILNGKVYDFSDFLDSHPGGDEILLEYHGRDITDIMKGFDPNDPDGLARFMLHEHSDSAYRVADEFLIGEIVDSSVNLQSEVYGGIGTTATISTKLIGNSWESNQATDPITTIPHLSSDKSSSFVGICSVNAITTGTVDATLGSDPEKDPNRDLPTIDFTKPIFPQIWSLNLTRNQYVRFVHTPHHLPGIARFFGNPIMELLSRNPWWVVPMVWLPIIAYALSKSVFAGNMEMSVSNAVMIVAAFLFGVINWTLIEYSLHRFLFHMDDRMPDHHIIQMLHFTLHGVHHFLPMDRMRLVFPPVLAMPLAVFFFSVFHSLYGPRFGTAVFAGGATGYIIYDLFHYFLHHGKVMLWLKKQHQKSVAAAASGMTANDVDVSVGAYLTRMKTYHMDHHYKDYHEGYGITTKFWDWTFGTLIEAPQKKEVK